MNAIPKDMAYQICQEIRLEQITRWYSWFFSPGWGWTILSNGNPAIMRICDRAGYAGCERVNERFQKQIARRQVSLSTPSLPLA